MAVSSVADGNDGHDGLLRHFLSQALNQAAERRSDYFEQQKRLIEALVKSASFDDLIVKPGTGKGFKAEIPWMGFRLARLAPNFMSGVYVVYLFSPAFHTVSLCLGQGVSDFSGHKKGEIGKPNRDDLRRLRQRAGALRESLEIPKRFNVDSIALGATRSARAPAYENSVVCARIYDCNNLPPESELYDDLVAMLRLYYEVPSDYDDEVNALVFAGGEHKPLVRPYKIGQEENASGKPGKDIDGEARRQRIERRKKVHRQVLDDVALAAGHANLRADFSEYADLIVDGHWLIEVKSIGEKDAVARVRGAIAQLFHYKFLHRQECPHAELIAVFSRKPLTQEGSDELIEFMSEIGIIPCWQEPSGTFASLDKRAPAWLVSNVSVLVAAI